MPGVVDVGHAWTVNVAVNFPIRLVVTVMALPVSQGLAGTTHVVPVPVPLDCVDGFNEAYYGRPEALLDPLARLSCSAWSFVDETAQQRFAGQLGGDLEDGRWDDRFGHLRSQPTFDGSLVLVVTER